MLVLSRPSLCASPTQSSQRTPLSSHTKAIKVLPITSFLFLKCFVIEFKESHNRIKKQIEAALFTICVNDLISSHATPAVNDCSVVVPVGVYSQANAPQFRITVIQQMERKDCFLDLWRSVFWATNAPGQPPASESKCKVFSGVRQTPFLAARLSNAYMMKVSKLEEK
jgi:hypothetical protein